MAWFLQHAHAVINTFHNCARHQCAIGPSKVVWQECFLGSLKEDRLIHTNPDDVVMLVNSVQPHCWALIASTTCSVSFR